MILPASSICNQYYTIALTALYLYDYLLTFPDEVCSYLQHNLGHIGTLLCYS